jgi:hypothetical protein
VKDEVVVSEVALKSVMVNEEVEYETERVVV